MRFQNILINVAAKNHPSTFTTKFNETKFVGRDK